MEQLCDFRTQGTSKEVCIEDKKTSSKHNDEKLQSEINQNNDPQTNNAFIDNIPSDDALDDSLLAIFEESR